MNIGELSKQVGVSSKMIRHYEEIGLITKASRTLSGYRSYSEKDIHVLRFIKRSRDFGFPVHEIKKLLGLWSNKKRASSEVKRVAQNHIDQLEIKINELKSIQDSLKTLARACKGDSRPDCPFLDDFSSNHSC